MKQSLSILLAAAACLLPAWGMTNQPAPTNTESNEQTEERPAPRLIDLSITRPLADAEVTLTALDSYRGRQLLAGSNRQDFQLLEPNWIPQYSSHCGAASAVVVSNALRPDLEFTQDCLFVPETEHIITQDVVYRIGFTLEELTDMIRTRSQLHAVRYHAGEEEGQFGYEAWVEELKRSANSADHQILVNFALGWLYQRTNTAGHFSPIAAYNEAENQILVLEVNPTRNKYWVDAREMWDAMNKVDSVSGLVRGWIVVENAPPTDGE